MLTAFPNTKTHLDNIDVQTSDPLDRKAKELIYNEDTYERASQALRRRFVRGAEDVEGIDRSGRLTKIKREKSGGKYKYYILGKDGSWTEPDERIWVVAMYALWQENK